jgi:endonuclease YncB( thermonuclease family)
MKLGCLFTLCSKKRSTGDSGCGGRSFDDVDEDLAPTPEEGAESSQSTEADFQGTSQWARLKDVPDGDSCKVVLSIGGLGLRTVSVRLYGNGIDVTDEPGVSAGEGRDALVRFLVPAECRGGGSCQFTTKKDLTALLRGNVVYVWAEFDGVDTYGRTHGSVTPFRR